MFTVDELIKATGGRLISGRRNLPIKGISIDSRTIKRDEVFIAIRGNNFDGHNFINTAIKKGASCIIQRSPGHQASAEQSAAYPKGSAEQSAAYPKGTRSPGVVFIGVKDTVKALGDIARYQRSRFDIPLIAITGSNGKTTTKEMTAWLLSKRIKVLKNEGTRNNQIGLPLTLLNLNRNHDTAVLELGTNHFGEIDYLAKICLPNIGVITNIGPAHLEYFNNLKGILREKYSLIENLKNPYLAILNSDDKLLTKIASRSGSRPHVLSFGIRKKSEFSASRIRFSHGKFEFLVNQKYKFTLKTLGYHNIYNALVAISIARIFGMGYREAASRLAVFEFPAGRFKLERLNRVNFIDDTYNSNPLSLDEALRTLANLEIKGRRIFVMGDMLELGSQRRAFHYRMGEKINRACDIFIAVGKLSELTAHAAKSSGFNAKNIFTCDSVGQARTILLDKLSATSDDLVLVKGSRAMKMEEMFNNH